MTTYAGRPIFPAFFVDPSGNPQEGLLVTVYNRGTTVKPTLYTDRTKATPADNPFLTDVYGNAFPYLDPGDYDAVANGSIPIPFSVLPDPAEPVSEAAVLAAIPPGTYVPVEGTAAVPADTAGGNEKVFGTAPYTFHLLPDYDGGPPRLTAFMGGTTPDAEPPYDLARYDVLNGQSFTGVSVTLSNKRIDINGAIQRVQALPGVPEPNFLDISNDADAPCIAVEAHGDIETLGGGRRNQAALAVYDQDVIHSGATPYSLGFGTKKFIISGRGAFMWGEDLGMTAFDLADNILERQSDSTLALTRGNYLQTFGVNIDFLGLATPSGVTVVSQGTTGATTYGYRVAAVNARGTTIASATVTTTTGNATLTGTNKNRVTWAKVVGAVSYKVYGRTSGSELLLATVPVPTLTWDDTGAVTPAGALPGAPAGLTARIMKWAGQTSDIFKIVDEANGDLIRVTPNGSMLAANWFLDTANGLGGIGTTGWLSTVPKWSVIMGPGRAGIGIKGSAGYTEEFLQLLDDGDNKLFTFTTAGLPKWAAAANQQTTVGAAGGASALPATPTKYLKVVDSAGTTFVVPAYAAA